MFSNFADFLLGVALSRRSRIDHSSLRSPSRPRGEIARHEDLGWMARVGTW